MADQTRVDYEALTGAAAVFDQEGQRIKQTTQRLARRAQALCGQSWIGRGAEAFHKEMESEVLPGLKRLELALTESSRALRALRKHYQDAEAEAAAYLKLSADGDSGGAGTVGGEAGAAGGAAAGGGVPDRMDAGSEYGSAQVSQEIKDKWATLSLDEKKAALQNAANAIAKQNGLDSLPVSVEQIPDPAGANARGKWDGSTIHLDVDDINDPAAAFTTLAHEARHGVQEKLIAKADQGALAQYPRGIDAQDIQKWKTNLKSYKAPPPRYTPSNPENVAAWDAYQQQPVEYDAWCYGQRFTKFMSNDEFNSYLPPKAAPAAPAAAPK